MHIPESLQLAIEDEIEQFGLNKVLEARKELTERYRNPTSKPQNYITKEEHRLAYIVARMPATYAVVAQVLKELRLRSSLLCRSLLDLGAGPGTAMWATSDVFPDIEKITLIERDMGLAAIGKRLASKNEFASVRNADWQKGDLEQLSSFPVHDLIILSYSIGELSNEKIPSVIQKCWEAANQFLVIIEPGTPVGFERIRMIRNQLFELKAHMVAPCPHYLACPMKGGDWCHFSERVERTSLHRRIKEGTLGHEDEKYSYLVVAKSPVELPQGRILRYPLKKSGHVNLVLCTPEGVKNETVSKRNPELYRQARKSEWGDSFPGSSLGSS